MYKDAMSPLARCVKRTIDILASFFGMVLLSPFHLAIRLAIKIEDGGKPIFFQMLEHLRMDLEYLTHRSIGYDFKIIFLTVTSIVTGKKF